MAAVNRFENDLLQPMLGVTDVRPHSTRGVN